MDDFKEKHGTDFNSATLAAKAGFLIGAADDEFEAILRIFINNVNNGTKSRKGDTTKRLKLIMLEIYELVTGPRKVKPIPFRKLH